MVLARNTNDNSVKYIPEKAQSQPNSSYIKPNMIKKNSLPKKQNEKLSQDKKNLIYDYITGEGFRINKRKKNCNSSLGNILIR